MTDVHRLNRRKLFGVAATGAALAGTGALAPAARGWRGDDWGWGPDGSVPRRRRGIQLYTMRRLLEAGKPQAAGVLAKLAWFGYEELELAGTFGYTPSELRRLTDRLGLRIVSSHNDPSVDWEQTLENANVMGQRFIGLAWFPPPYNEEIYRQLAERLNVAGTAAKEAGLRFFYHNHDFDFATKQADGTPVYNILLEETDPDLVEFQLDLYWIMRGGESPIDYLSAAPERYPCYHVKDRTWKNRTGDEHFEDVGPGSLDFPDMFAAGAGDRWRRLDKHYFIEHDWPLLSHPDDPEAELKTAEAGIRYLSRVRF